MVARGRTIADVTARRGHWTLRAEDPYEAQRLVSEVYLPHRLLLPVGTTTIEMELTGIQLGMLTAGRLSYGRKVRTLIDKVENFFVHLPITGQVLVRCGGREPVILSPGQLAVYSPGERAEVLWSADCSQLCLMVPRVTVETELEVLMGRPLRGELRFDFETRVGTQVGRRWRTALDLVLDELDEPSGLSGYLAAARHLEKIVLDGLLLSHRHTHSETLLQSAGWAAARPATLPVRRAVELMEERPTEGWTTERLAREVHLSVRALQEAFSRDLEMPPMAYLRDVRLRRVREYLEQASAETTTVRAVANGFGFRHLGRFAAVYRQAFGETPVATLRRSPGS